MDVLFHDNSKVEQEYILDSGAVTTVIDEQNIFMFNLFNKLITNTNINIK